MARTTRDQKRAAKALEHFEKITSGEARKRLESLPTMILENGLLVALVFLAGNSKLKPIRDKLQDWLHGEEAGIPWDNPKEPDIAKRLVSAELPVFQMAQYEALRYANWLKRWAQANAQENGAAGQGQPA